jgi:hypothetical protein
MLNEAIMCTMCRLEGCQTNVPTVWRREEKQLSSTTHIFDHNSVLVSVLEFLQLKTVYLKPLTA